MGSNEYGYIGDTPTQSSTSNTGVFGSDDIYDLINSDQWALQPVALSYLVIAGGGSGGFNNSGGGGAGGYRNSYASESSGGNSSTESFDGVILSQNYTVTVGAGGTPSKPTDIIAFKRS